MSRIELPVVRVCPSADGFEGTCALALESILKRELLLPADGGNDQAQLKNLTLRLLSSREGLVEALASWTRDIALELRISTLPNLGHPLQGRCWITLVLRVRAESSEEASASALRGFLALSPLLGAFLAEAQFRPVVSDKRLAETMDHFTPLHARAIVRRRETLDLSSTLPVLRSGFFVPPASSAGEPNRVSFTCPWTPSFDDMSTVLDYFAGLLDPLTLLVRVRPAAIDLHWVAELWEKVQACEEALAHLDGGRLTFTQNAGAVRDLLLRRLADLRPGGMQAGVFLVSPVPIDPSVPRVAGNALFGKGPLEGGNPLDGRFAVETVAVEKALDPGYFPETEPFSVRETAAAFRLPDPPVREISGLPLRRYRTAPALSLRSPSREDESIELFFNEHQAACQAVQLAVEERMRHLFILGQTGTGKSTLMENMILQDIRAGRGVGVIDPHGDMVEAVLAAMPPERAEEVILFDLLDREWIQGFNILEWTTLPERDLLIDEMYLALERIYDLRECGGPIFENNFRGMLKLLMGDGSKGRGEFVPTLIDFIHCYTRPEFRAWLSGTCDDPYTREFVRELEKTGGEACVQNLSPYVTSKLGRFVHDDTLKRIFGCGRSSFDINRIVEKGGIFLMKVGKGRVGSKVSALLTDLVISRFKLAAMRQGDRSAEERRDFFLYADEVHNLPPENFTELLSEARKYRLSLTLATQYARQLAVGNPSLLSAIQGNVGTTILFRLGLEDADLVANLLAPNFSPRDIVGLPDFHGYARTSGCGGIPYPYSFRTRPVPFPCNPAVAEEVRSLSRTRSVPAMIADGLIGKKAEWMASLKK